MTSCFLPDSIAQQAYELSQDPGRSHVFREIGIRWAGDRDELSTRLQHSERFVERLSPETIQNDIVVPKDGCEIVLAVIDDDICTEGFDPIEIRRACCGS